jgi:hypothetical protein
MRQFIFIAGVALIACGGSALGDVCGPGTHDDRGTCVPGAFGDDAGDPVHYIDGGDRAPRGDAAAASDAPTDGVPGSLMSGTEALVALFPVPAGAIVVTSTAVTLLARDGAKRATWSSGREITAAAFDGVRLAIADKGKLAVLDANLVASRTDVTLVESCGAAIIVDGGRFVCGPTNDWDRIFYVYDLATGAMLGSSAKYTYNGIPMHRVPGTNDFVTVDDELSPSHFHLYRVPASSVVEFQGESPDHGAFPVSDRYAFAGEPATHLITETGLMLRIYDPSPPDASAQAIPFVKDGSLGTLDDTHRFLALDQTSTDAIAIVGANDYARALCSSGCDLQRIDIAARRVTTTHRYVIDTQRVLLLRHDATVGRAWIASTLAGKETYDPTAGFSIALLAY